MKGLENRENWSNNKKGVARYRVCRLIYLLLAVSCLVGLFCLAGCGKKKEKEDGLDLQVPLIEITPSPTPTPTPSPTPTPTPTPTPNPYEGKKQSMLTGEWIPEETAELRPYAVMLNNIKVASPQSGIGQADILYEALTEAGITRFLAIYSKIEEDSPAAERLGSVRSARHYFVSFADEYDAIFVHFGETTYATKKMAALGIDHITGMYGVGVSSFYRDNSIKAPHNAFASLAGIEKAVERAGFRTEYEEGYESHFRFYKEDTDIQSAGNVDIGLGTEADSSHGTEADPEGIPETMPQVNRLTLGFSAYTSPYFIYHAEDKLYYRYQFDGEHTDYNTGETLAFKNIIIQFVNEWNIDKNGYQTMEIEKAEGKGYYITNGSIQEITWKKDESRRFMRYYAEDGEELTINPGKTYIAVFPDSRTKYVVTE